MDGLARGGAGGRRLTMLELLLRRAAREPLQILCLGAHSDDIEIGCGGAILQLTRAYPAAQVRWIVLSAGGGRRDEALAGAARFLAGAAKAEVVVADFRPAFFPYAGNAIKEYVAHIGSGPDPDLVFTHYRSDRHQDHTLLSDLTWQTFRRSLILEYEIPKWDGDLGTPNCYVRLPDDLVEEKIRAICEIFISQRGKHWFTPDAFRALMRLRGVEANAHFAEAFYARKLALA